MSQAAPPGPYSILRFALGPHQCGVPVRSVREVVRIVAVTRIPEGPPFLEGVVDLRGTLVPVLDLRRRFGLSPGPFDTETRILITDLRGRPAGLIVDEVTEVAAVEPDHMGIDLVDSLGFELRSVTRVVQVEERIVMVLDLDKVLTQDEFRQLESSEHRGGA
ncbi:MAG: purine-binding chemotaxis protein CheW [Elusimicrobia bacterium]|nr:purine-binding chemotaxis protein CheW [Elusimicrobiota bacterium]